EVEAASNSVVTNVIGIEVGRGIKLSLQIHFPGQLVICPQARVEDVEPRTRACVGVCPEACRIVEAVEVCRFEYRYVFRDAQRQPARAISPLKVKILIKCVLI